MRLLGMSLQIRCCESPNQTGPSPHRVPVYRVSTAALKSVRFLNRGETTSKLSMAESILSAREYRLPDNLPASVRAEARPLSGSPQLLHLGPHGAPRIRAARDFPHERAPHDNRVHERREREDLLVGGDSEPAEHLHAGGQ